jgi:hypothetical protein
MDADLADYRAPACGTADALCNGMKTDVNFIELISSVVGLSLGISVATATAILGVAALLQ